jgi:hypothetical protein
MISTQRYYAWTPGVAFPRYGTLPWGGSAYQWTVGSRTLPVPLLAELPPRTGFGLRQR